jgi:hypothetical protein
MAAEVRSSGEEILRPGGFSASGKRGESKRRLRPFYRSIWVKF